jgi:surface antigen
LSGIIRRSARWLAVLLVLIGLPALSVATASPASADTLGYPHYNVACAHYPYSTTGTCPNYDWGTGWSPRGYGYRNCTDYVAWRLEGLGVSTSLTRGRGNGMDWDSSSSGVTIDGTPEIGDAAVWNSGTYGHVAFVEAVRAKAGGGWEVTVSEYNHAGTGEGSYRSWLQADNYVDFNGTGTPLGTPAASGQNQFLADVTGDGKDDAVVFYPGPGLAGNWYVAPSTGSSFAPASLWLAGTGAGSDKRFLADVDGDGKDDAIAYWNATGNWHVALSTGSGFSGATQWSTGQINGSSNQLVADVTGDGKADALALSLGAGTWYASASNGSNAFTGFGQWITGHGAGSNRQFAVDVNGGGAADATAYFGSPNGWFYTGLSTGSAFAGATQWSSGQISGSDKQLMGDVTGDGKADALALSLGAGTWYASASNGSNAFTGFGQWITGYGVGSTNQLLGDVTGDGKADAVIYEGAQGNWWVMPSSGSSFTGPPGHWMTQFGIGS